METFTDKNILFLTGLVLLMVSLMIRNKKPAFSILILTFSAFCIFLYASLLDPFLNQWDERFHALVAKNMISDPLKPMLFTSSIPGFEYDNWDKALIWLHKQPLFLWQMSLSIQLFGTGELAVRLPSVMLATLLIPISFRTAGVIFNKKSGYYTALLFLSSYFLFELVSGRQGMEHNDTSFLFYVSASIWGFAEYSRSRKIIWVLIIGLFSGAAILTKWLVGFFVYLLWGSFLVFNKEINTREILRLSLAFFLTIAIALPWQIYIFRNFPQEAYTEFVYNSLHFTDVLEGHGGDFLFHFTKFPELYGKLFSILIPLALVFLFSSRKFKWPILLSILFVYLFYSLAKTKLPAYPFVISLLIFSCLGHLIYKLENWLPKKLYFLFFIFLPIILFMNLRPHKIDQRHNVFSQNNQYTLKQEENKKRLLELKYLLPENAVVFNVQGRHYVEAMFYTGCQVYPGLPTSRQIRFLTKQGKRPVIIYRQICDIPYDLQTNKKVILIRQKFNFFDT